MDPNLYFVFSQKPDWVSREEYHAWYVDHAQENIESPGFLSAQRYVAREVQNGRAVGVEQHLCVYQYEGDMKVWRDSLSERIKTGDIVLKDWHYDIDFHSWTCSPVGGLLTPKTH